jgi:hypothetical protein
MKPLLTVGLIMLKIAVGVYGIPIPLPDLKDVTTEETLEMLSHISQSLGSCYEFP